MSKLIISFGALIALSTSSVLAIDSGHRVREVPPPYAGGNYISPTPYERHPRPPRDVPIYVDPVTQDYCCTPKYPPPGQLR